MINKSGLQRRKTGWRFKFRINLTMSFKAMGTEEIIRGVNVVEMKEGSRTVPWCTPRPKWSGRCDKGGREMEK